MPLQLTSRDEELLLGLTKRFRCVSAELVAAYFWPEPARKKLNAQRRLRLLEEAGWLRSSMAFAKRLPNLTQPVATWSPGKSAPDFGKISYHLKHRSQTSAAAIRIFIASRLAAKRYGGSCDRWPRRSETTHDLGLAQVYLELKSSAGPRAKGWISEAALVSGGTVRGNKLPDAMIKEASGTLTVIEFGGEYGKAKLIEFHEDCARKNRGYELW